MQFDLYRSQDDDLINEMKLNINWINKLHSAKSDHAHLLMMINIGIRFVLGLNVNIIDISVASVTTVLVAVYQKAG